MDRRVDAGIDMDGTMQYSEGDFVQVAREGLDRPSPRHPDIRFIG
ncbi:hypothetical protein [Thermomonospora cellulosilytica]|uniref:Uncharacterized protein n=1 Tax=Thermomonospora cellulosilytica TaxID=1411118 RepID=A0A7W3R6T1_9ACTN|nr:hypothetical protein [Thermomonospora cellulosilytica]MBA9001769.1 hypothetical protein [Thermomonospora cellulosilytica]